MAKTPNMEKERKVVSKAHHNWVPTEDIKVRLAETHPRLEFRWLEKEHIHGVDSIVHGTCHEHHQVVPMHVGNLWRGTTKYGCPACAYELGGECEGSETFHVKRNHPNYQGRSKVEFNLFMAVKDAFPDALSGHKMKGRKEIDIWVPSIGAGVEYNGTLYHSSKMGKDEKYHIQKTKQANRENKQIFHLFPEEAEDVGRVVRLLRLLKAARNPVGTKYHLRPKAKLEVRVVPAEEASRFHSEWNPFGLRDSLIHLDLGLYEDGTLVALFGVNLKERVVVKSSYAKVFLEPHKVLTLLSENYGGAFALAADARNPIEFGVCESAILSKKIAFVGASRPLAIPLEKSFAIPEMGFSAMSDSEGFSYADRTEHIALTWDCGMLIYCKKNDRPLFPQ